ncbi:MAG: hypothetical protein WCH75_19900 [Candidatus Binatia bacterium]
MPAVASNVDEVGGTNKCKGAFMAPETFKKRQKETARREKKQKKAARLMERRTEKARTESDPEEEKENTADSVS